MRSNSWLTRTGGGRGRGHSSVRRQSTLRLTVVCACRATASVWEQRLGDAVDSARTRAF